MYKVLYIHVDGSGRERDVQGREVKEDRSKVGRHAVSSVQSLEQTNRSTRVFTTEHVCSANLTPTEQSYM